MKEFFNLKCDYQDMSPVIIPSGYTKDYIDGKVTCKKHLIQSGALQFAACYSNFQIEIELTCCYLVLLIHCRSLKRVS
jgi:hypothetical protein